MYSNTQQNETIESGDQESGEQEIHKMKKDTHWSEKILIHLFFGRINK